MRSTFPNVNSTVRDLRSYLLSIPQARLQPERGTRGGQPRRSEWGGVPEESPPRTYAPSLPLQQVGFVIDSSNVPLGNTNDSLQSERAW